MIIKTLFYLGFMGTFEVNWRSRKADQPIEDQEAGAFNCSATGKHFEFKVAGIGVSATIYGKFKRIE